MARKAPSPPGLRRELDALNHEIPQDLFVPSLRSERPCLRGYAFRFFLVLPLYTSTGQRVFIDEHLSELHVLFDARCGGCLVTSSRTSAPYFGEYQPAGSAPVRDYHTIVIVYANPVEASDRFFEELKSILRKAPLIEQDEILVERSEVFLV